MTGLPESRLNLAVAVGLARVSHDSLRLRLRSWNRDHFDGDASGLKMLAESDQCDLAEGEQVVNVELAASADRENDLRRRLGRCSLSLAAGGDFLGERSSSFGVVQELFDGDMDLREQMTRVVGSSEPLDVDELIAGAEQVAVLDAPWVNCRVDEFAIEKKVPAVPASNQLVVVLLLHPFGPRWKGQR